MAASRLFQAARLGTVGVMAGVPFFISKVHAIGGPYETSSRRMKISELPIYDNPEEGIRYKVIDEEISEFRSTISEGRQAVWEYLDTIQRRIQWIQDTTAMVKKHYEEISNYLSDHVTLLEDDPGALPRAAVITLAGLGGLVAAHKGGMFKRILFSGTAMAAAAAMCYPNQAVDISTTGYNHGYTFVMQTWDSINTEKMKEGNRGVWYGSETEHEACKRCKNPREIVCKCTCCDRKKEVEISRTYEPEKKQEGKSPCCDRKKEVEISRTYEPEKKQEGKSPWFGHKKEVKTRKKSTNEKKEEPKKKVNTTSEKKPANTNPVLMDHGQSNPADKDMYTTRGR